MIFRRSFQRKVVYDKIINLYEMLFRFIPLRKEPPMNYKNQLDSELKKTARRVPFNRLIVRVGNIYQAAALKLVRLPRGVSVKTIETEGYQGLKFKTELITPADAERSMPALIYAHGGAFCYKAATYHKRPVCLIPFPDQG